MDTREALLAAVNAAPPDDTPRLVYADWLDENARTGAERDRAEFIRLQVRTSRLEAPVRVTPAPVQASEEGVFNNAVFLEYDHGPDYHDLKARETELWIASGAAWLTEAVPPALLGQVVMSAALPAAANTQPGGGVWHWKSAYQWNPYTQTHEHSTTAKQVVFRRGFLDQITLDPIEAQWWLENITAHNPLGRVVFLARPRFQANRNAKSGRIKGRLWSSTRWYSMDGFPVTVHPTHDKVLQKLLKKEYGEHLEFDWPKPTIGAAGH